MLAEGEQRARAATANNTQSVPAGSDDLPVLRSTLGTFRAALMGESFHWMVEKDRVPQDLSTMIDPVDGAVAFVSNRLVSAPDAFQEATARVHARGLVEPWGERQVFDEVYFYQPVADGGA